MATVMNAETVMNTEKDPVDFEVLPEYIRESKGRPRETAEIAAPRIQPDRHQSDSDLFSPLLESDRTRSSKGEMLETLWPGVHHEFAQSVKRSPSFYLTVGFMAGAFLSLIGVWLFSMVSPMVADMQKSSPATVVTKNPNGGATSSSESRASGGAMVPLVSTYEVQAGDTLAAIAYKNYKRCSPRLLDEICQANKLASANVLNLGQKLILPEYHPSQAASKIAATTPPSVQ
jgi:LysM repeat protein